MSATPAQEIAKIEQTVRGDLAPLIGKNHCFTSTSELLAVQIEIERFTKTLSHEALIACG
jgi:hypothetical protein